MEQPLAESPTSPTREERELQVSRPYGTPLVDLRQMLEGDVPQDKMTCLFFVKEGIRKLSDLNTARGNKYTVYFNKVAGGKDELLQAGTCATNMIGKHRVRPCLKGQVTVPEQILPLVKPNPRWAFYAQNSWHDVAVSGSQERDDCAMKREPCHSGSLSRMGL